MTALLELDDVVVTYPGVRRSPFGRRPRVRALAGVSFVIHEGETLGVVGESGSGKSTLARAIVGLVGTSGGSIRFDGTEVRAGHHLGRDVQMVFQDPFASVNPERTVRQIIAEPIGNLAAHLSKAEVDERIRHVLDTVQLPASYADRRPRSLSGGQLQRVGIARALAVDPRLLVADEAVSALDVSVQAQILNLLADLKDARQITSLFISHNLAIVEHVADRIAVMFAGRIVEIGDASVVVDRPAHPYTRGLLAAVPRLGSRSRTPRSTEPGLAAIPAGGCPYAGRSAFAVDVCTTTDPPLRLFEAGHAVACHRAEELPPASAPREPDRVAVGLRSTPLPLNERT